MKYPDTMECGALSASELRRLVDVLRTTPGWLRHRLEHLPEARSRLKPGPGAEDFAPIEHVCHLLDIERLGYSRRLRRTLAEAHPFLEDVDGTRLAVEQWYLAQPLAPALDAFASERAANIALLDRLTPADLDRTADLEGVGCVTLAQLLIRWRDHDLGHRDEIAALL